VNGHTVGRVRIILRRLASVIHTVVADDPHAAYTRAFWWLGGTLKIFGHGIVFLGEHANQITRCQNCFEGVPLPVGRTLGVDQRHGRFFAHFVTSDGPQKERKTWFLSLSFLNQAIAAMQSISISNGPGQAGTLMKILAGASFEKNRT